jgi:hypothetical protein
MSNLDVSKASFFAWFNANRVHSDVIRPHVTCILGSVSRFLIPNFTACYCNTISMICIFHFLVFVFFSLSCSLALPAQFPSTEHYRLIASFPDDLTVEHVREISKLQERVRDDLGDGFFNMLIGRESDRFWSYNPFEAYKAKEVSRIVWLSFC